ncbi:MAG TPA: hydroxyacid dehydrogenase [Aliidongia sp.]|nr:hydroxyacid dehydrogenase [Aliidongia sp.]
MTDILITEYLDDAAVRTLAAEFAVHYDPTLVGRPDDIAALGADVPALIVRHRTQVRGAVLDAFKRLRVVGRLGVGLDNIDVETCRARGIEVCPARGANAVSVAEYVIAACFIGLRNVWQVTDAVLAGQWPRNELMLSEVSGKRMGLIGFGDIGRQTAIRARALGMEVVASERAGFTPEPFEGVEFTDLATLLATSDVISLHAPFLPETRNLIDRAALGRMKKGAVLINSARGGMIDDAALADALKSGHLRAAFLDAFEIEPLPVGSVLAGAPNLFLTPHVAGVTEEANLRVSSVTVANVQRVLRGRG